MARPIDLLDGPSLAGRRPFRIAHRGGVVGPGAPENSLASIERAAGRGYDLVELDVVASRDGEPFLFHDRGGHLGRCCGVDRRVSDLSATELAAVTYRASDQRCGALVVPAINTFRYPEHAHRELARQDVERLWAAGVDGFQIDATYEELLPARTF